jgi:hypothetical protein
VVQQVEGSPAGALPQAGTSSGGENHNTRHRAARQFGHEQLDIAKGKIQWVSGFKQLWRITMTTLKSVAIIAALLAGGTSLAIAQNGASANSKGTSRTATSAASALHGTDTVILSVAQRSAVWNDLSKQATNQNAVGFDATIGTFVPNTVKIEPIPSKVTASNPSLRPYGFAMVDQKLVIVDPSNKVIANVLTK